MVQQSRCARCWAHVLDLGLTLWVLRAIAVAIALGFAVLGLAPQAQDLLVDVAAGPWWYIVLFLLALFFVWAMPTHYASRLLVNTDRRYLVRVRRRRSAFLDHLQIWSPRLLGFLPFVAMGIGVIRSYVNVPGVEPSSVTANARWDLIVLGGAIALAAVVYVLYAVERLAIARFPLFREAEAAAKTMLDPIAAKIPRALALGRHAPGLSRQDSSLGPIYLGLMFVAFTIAPFIWPFYFAEWFPRAIAVPFVLAGWTPLAAYASGVGRHLRVPIISFAILGSALLTYFLGDNYTVRRVNAAEHASELQAKASQTNARTQAARATAPVPIARRQKLNAALDLWKRANNCENDGSACPRPIIIAASGGASRAGFFTASVIGKLLDGGAGLAGSDSRKRLFAISSVSGSSVSAVMAVAALATSDDRNPCRDKSHYLLHTEKVTNWQSCLEALMSGDFLTPVFAGLVFRDTLRFLGAFGGSGSAFGWSDRASLIERSWEAQFADSVEIKGRAAERRSCVGNLDCPFWTLRPLEWDGQVDWLPLMLLNGASVSTGQRIITATIDPWYCPGMRHCAEAEPMQRGIFAQAFDFHLLLDDSARATGIVSWLQGLLGRNDSSSLGRRDDVRLSTAAHNSARFPLISPPGEVLNRADNVVDRIVDGGYFENFGAQTALELARAMRAIDRDLAPFILIVSNDPEIPIDDELKTPNANEGQFFTDLSSPANALLNTRAARGTLAVDAVVAVLADELTEACIPYAAHVRAWPEYESIGAGRKESDRKVRPLSFSWWLSKPVQMRLHQQTLSKDNGEAFAAVAKALAPKRSDCTGKDQPVPSSMKFEGVRQAP